MRRRAAHSDRNLRAPVYGRFVSAYGRLGAPFLSFLLSSSHRREVFRRFRKAPVLEKVEMVLLGTVLFLFGLLVTAMAATICFFFIVTLLGVIRDVVRWIA